MHVLGAVLVSFSAVGVIVLTSVAANVATGDADVAPGDVTLEAVWEGRDREVRRGEIERSGRAAGHLISRDRIGGPLVVIDPGHGGANTGASGVGHGFYEKELTLALARDLADRLKLRGIRAMVTRDQDVYMTLRQRVDRANQVRADLFVSLHANASDTHLRRGYETFILSPRAVDIDGRALRIAEGPSRRGVDARTARILDDLERGMAQPRAAALAAEIQNQLRLRRGPDGDRGVRQDAMHVLLGATMPAVLVEVGFLDHVDEGRELRDPGVQAKICGALATAIARVLSWPAVPTGSTS